MPTTDASKEAVRVTLVGMWLDIGLGIAKLAGGTASGSFALITDGVHSLSDAVSDIFVLLVSRFSHDEPDAEHPYGHGRFEAVGTVVMGMLFFAIAAIFLYDSFLRLSRDIPLLVPTWPGLVVAAISVFSKEWIYHYTMRTAMHLNSSLLRANAWHSRTDAISSVAVLIGIFGAQQGFPWLDVVAAMFVALIIGKIGLELCMDSLKELVDTAIPLKYQDEIKATVKAVSGVNKVSNLRSRESGGKVLLEIQIQVDPRISVSEGHQIGEAARKNVTDKFTNINDVIVHIDPEPHDDFQTLALPLRGEIVALITSQWQNLLPPSAIKNIELHYLGNSVEVDLYLEASHVDPQLAEKLSEALKPIKPVSKLKIYSNVLETNVTDKLS